MNYPDLEGRVDILKVHSRGKPLAADVDLDNIAKRMPYSTGADLENVMNEARHSGRAPSRRSRSASRIWWTPSARVQMGPEKTQPQGQSQAIVTITAYHEAGHAVIANLLPECDDVHLITIVPRGQAGGYTLSLPRGRT